HTVPYRPATAQAKARARVERLTAWQYASRLYLVPFGEIQRGVVLGVPPPLRVVVYRRLMLRITQELARRGGALALATGESLGQVASQTLENIACIDEAASLPVLRPLIGMDKLEITTAAQQIGTFEISIEPDADCCTLFTPRHPATRATLDEIRAAEVALNLDRLVAAGAAGAHRVIDHGTHSTASVDYPDYAAAVAEAVRAGGAERGVLVCGSGIGMAMAANKVAGVRAAVAGDPDVARLSRQHNDANVLALGARLTTPTQALAVVQAWLATPFEGGRHARRVDKLSQLDELRKEQAAHAAAR